MITWVTTFKPFVGINAIHQLNALKSWLRFCPPCEVLIVGNEVKSVDNQLAEEGRVTVVDNVARNKYGTPLLNSILELAKSYSRNDYIGLILGDIILLSDPLEILKLVRQKFQKFLIFSLRYEADISYHLDFSNTSVSSLKNYMKGQDPRKKVFPADVFIFPKQLIETVNVPPLAIGRGVWARWLIYMAYITNSPVIDATDELTILHQIHDYRHVVGAPSDWSELKKSEEYRENARLIGVAGYFSDKDASYRIKNGKINYDFNIARIVRRSLKKVVLQPIILDFLTFIIPKTLRKKIKKLLEHLGFLY